MFWKSAITVVALSLLYDVSYAQIDETCESLKGGTPGLYGLCISYCSAANSIESQKNKEAILAKYNSKMQAGDPPMPSCDCPCFTYQQVAAIADKIPLADAAYCFNGDDPNMDVYQLIQVLIGHPPDDPYEEWEAREWASKPPSEELGCEYRDYAFDGSTSTEIFKEWAVQEPTDDDWLALEACVQIMDAIWINYGLPVSQSLDCE